MLWVSVQAIPCAAPCFTCSVLDFGSLWCLLLHCFWGTTTRGVEYPDGVSLKSGMVGAASLHASRVLRTSWNQEGSFTSLGTYGHFAVHHISAMTSQTCKMLKLCTNQKWVLGGRVSTFHQTMWSCINVHYYTTGLSQHLLLFYPEILSWQISIIACVYLGFPDIWECYQTGSHAESDLLCMHWTVCTLEMPEGQGRPIPVQSKAAGWNNRSFTTDTTGPGFHSMFWYNIWRSKILPMIVQFGGLLSTVASYFWRSRFKFIL